MSRPTKAGGCATLRQSTAQTRPTNEDRGRACEAIVESGRRATQCLPHDLFSQAPLAAAAPFHHLTAKAVRSDPDLDLACGRLYPNSSWTCPVASRFSLLGTRPALTVVTQHTLDGRQLTLRLLEEAFTESKTAKMAAIGKKFRGRIEPWAI